MEIKKRIYHSYVEPKEAKEAGMEIPCHFGKYQYFYSFGKNKISLVEFKNYFGDGKDFWEIYCLVGELFEDVERFDTKEEAETRIKELKRKGWLHKLIWSLIN
jgi:hypothetical protein